MFPPGASVLKGAIALGSLLLNPDSSLENLQRNRDQLNYNLEKIKLSNQNPKLKAILEKSLRVKIDIAKFLRSLEQFVQTVKGQNNFW